VRGTYLLAATAENAVALAPPGEEYTAFTGELVRLLEYGGPEETHEYLDLDTIFRQMRISLSLKGRPGATRAMPSPLRLRRERPQETRPWLRP
jgi:hypothetical protein